MAIRSKRINSRQKGKRGERAFRDVLREAGYLKARRGQQFSGEQGNPDVVCEELPEIHWEVKCCESGNIYTWLRQANGDITGFSSPFSAQRIRSHIPIVAHKRNGERWVAILEVTDLLEIIRRSDLPKVFANCTVKPLDCMGIPHNGKGKITIPWKNGEVIGTTAVDAETAARRLDKLNS